MGKIIDITNQRFGRLIALEIVPTPKGVKDRSKYWKCICDCGNTIIATGTNLRKGNTKSCGCLQKEKASGLNFKDLTNQRFGKLIALKPIKTSEKRIKWKCKCDCGNIVQIDTSNLIRGLTHSCGCLKNKSINEKNIENLLRKNNIPFQTQYKVKYNNKIFYFDFYINNQYFIEFDGEQHFHYKKCSGWNNKENFNKTRTNDLLKNQYCFKYNIPLIRIPYNKQYDFYDLLLQTTKFLLTPQNEIIYYERQGTNNE